MSIFWKKYKSVSLKSLNNGQKLKLTGFFIFLTITIWFFFIYSEINKQIAYNTNLLQQINEKKALIEKSENKCIKMENKIINLKSNINCSSNKDIKKEIINYAKDAGISLKSYTLLNENTKMQHNIAQEMVSYEFTGKIDQIIAFCQKINLCKHSLKCEEICITKKSDLECNIKCTLTLLKKL